VVTVLRVIISFPLLRNAEKTCPLFTKVLIPDALVKSGTSLRPQLLLKKKVLQITLGWLILRFRNITYMLINFMD